MLLFSGASFFVDLIYNLSTWFCVLVIISVIHIVLYCVLYLFMEIIDSIVVVCNKIMCQSIID